MSNQEEINSYFRLWSDELDSDGNNYSPIWNQYRTPAAIALLKDCVSKSGSLPSVSSFIIAFDALVKEGALRPVRAARLVEQDAPALTAAEYEKIPASVVVRRYRNESSFKEDVDRLIRLGQI